MNSARSTRLWTAAFVVVLVGLGGALCIGITKPWTGLYDYNCALWAQCAHNNLRAGLGKTLGVPTGFYFDRLPIPPEGFYVHHPPVVPLMVTATFALLGEHEWAGRLVPVACSLATALVLWLLMKNCVGVRAATLSVLVFALLPMELNFGRMINHEPCAMLPMLAAVLALRLKRRGLLLVALFIGMWTAWPAYILAVLIALWLCRSERSTSVAILALCAISALLYLWQIRLVRPDAWANFFAAFHHRLGVEAIGWNEWFGRQLEFVGLRLSMVGWLLAVGGAAIVARSKELRWLRGAALILSLTAAAFLVMFRNGSYIHDYWGFYFVAPVAMLGGVALDRAKPWVAMLLAAALAANACYQMRLLSERQYCILDWRTPEPRMLIVDLGRRIGETFAPDTKILCNLSYNTPQLEYYAQRQLLYGVTRPPEGAAKVGGVFWMDTAEGNKLVAELPRGWEQFVDFGGVRFCLWKRE